VLLLQGKDRAQQFDQIDQCDLVLTTYALLPRDEETLREHDFHLVILDESHYIKNTRSKAAQSAGLLRARHRLCLSGTPLENHLGELWSQFHFLLPGLLGDEKTFNTVFRHPIERQDDPLRRMLLNRRIKPFLLRRTKDNVAKELPPKTEMVRKVELTGAQRDLYETVRLAMDQKVREEIDRKGVARSQIVILEALLKLRQVCCDPRLVKSLPAKKQSAGSAKLLDLMQMVEDLLDEGRKILVFSQFTSMLELIEEELERATFLRPADRRDEGPQRPGGGLPAGRRADLPDQPESGRRGPEPDGGRHRDPLRSVVESGGGKPGHRPRLAHRPGQAGVRVQTDRQGHAGRKIQLLQQKKSELAQSILAEGESQKMALTQEDLQQIFAPLED
jgi:SNF2 family DNA or RNA helicase